MHGHHPFPPPAPAQSDRPLQALFVHGMGRSPLSGWPVLRQLRKAGMQTRTFGYVVTVQDFAPIVARLSARLATLASQGDYILIGHSLGGVLLRAALAALPAEVRPPTHVFLLGSPVRASRLARQLQGNPLFRALTGDCGQLLASDPRMQGIGPVTAPVTGIAGVLGASTRIGPFHNEPHDGVVSVSEVSADWLTDAVHVPVAHTFLPASQQVAVVILERMARTHPQHR